MRHTQLTVLDCTVGSHLNTPPNARTAAPWKSGLRVCRSSRRARQLLLSPPVVQCSGSCRSSSSSSSFSDDVLTSVACLACAADTSKSYTALPALDLLLVLLNGSKLVNQPRAPPPLSLFSML
eukprot:16247-Heterococcus_DN1.PRE.5